MKIVKKYIALLFAGALTFGAQAQNEITIHDNRFNEDETIGLPEGMSSDIDELLQQWCAKQYLYPDTTCQNPNVNPTYDEEVYRDRLARIPAVMEMSHNEVVQHFIDRYSGNLRRRVSYMLGAGNFYVPIFEEALDYYGLPLELKYLPVIESALDPTAVSPVGAAGLWQFMLTTAKRYNLEINSVVDERCDPIKSSYAAAHFLSDLYKIYGDWNLVIAAYNCGPGNVNKAIRRAGGLQDYWAIYPYLPKETRGYVPAFIAANYVMTYFKNHNISPSLAKKPLLTDTIAVNQRINFNQISKVLNMPIDELRVLNPQFRRDVIPGDTHSYSLCLPTHQVYSFIMSKDSILNYRTDLYGRRDVVEPATIADSQQDISGVEGVDFTYETQTVTKWHKVRRGETLAKIARNYGVTSSSIKRANGLRRSSVKRGQSLKIVTTQRVKVPIEKNDDPTNDELLAANNNADQTGKLK